MTLIDIKELAHLMMNSLGTAPRNKQALLQSYYGISLPDYPSLEEAGLTDQDGYFLVAGGRIKLLQHQAVDKVRKLLKSKIQSTPSLTDLRIMLDSLTIAPPEDQSFLPYLEFVIAATQDIGEHMDAPQSRP
jgi:hypothetical protein